jgi:hypothetical protein
VASRRAFRSSPAARWCVRDMGKGGNGAAAAAGSDWNGAVRCLGLALAMGRADWASYGQPNLSGHSSWFVFFFLRTTVVGSSVHHPIRVARRRFYRQFFLTDFRSPEYANKLVFFHAHDSSSNRFVRIGARYDLVYVHKCLLVHTPWSKKIRQFYFLRIIYVS